MRSRQKSHPYLPSYMNVGTGLDKCAVCDDEATGYHYQCMTCEGCKGFFRRTIQKNLQYFCKFDNDCIVNKATRTLCQACRYRKCLDVGMAVNLVLNEEQRERKRLMIQENRDRKIFERTRLQILYDEADLRIDPSENPVIQRLTFAFKAAANAHRQPVIVNSMAHAFKLIINGLSNYALQIPGFAELPPQVGQRIIHEAVFPWMFFLISRVLNDDSQGMNDIIGGNGTSKSRPISCFARSMAYLKLNIVEVSLIAAVMILHSGDMYDHETVEAIGDTQESIIGLLRRYIAITYRGDIVRWPKLLMRIVDLRGITQQLRNTMDESTMISLFSLLGFNFRPRLDGEMNDKLAQAAVHGSSAARVCSG